MDAAYVFNARKTWTRINFVKNLVKLLIGRAGFRAVLESVDWGGFIKNKTRTMGTKLVISKSGGDMSPASLE